MCTLTMHRSRAPTVLTMSTRSSPLCLTALMKCLTGMDALESATVKYFEYENILELDTPPGSSAANYPCQDQCRLTTTMSLSRQLFMIDACITDCIRLLLQLYVGSAASNDQYHPSLSSRRYSRVVDHAASTLYGNIATLAGLTSGVPTPPTIQSVLNAAVRTSRRMPI